MPGWAAATALALRLLTLDAGGQTQTPPEVIAEITVHGNHVASDADVVRIAGVAIGQPFTATTIADVTTRLRASKQFDDVSVLKRFASIADPSQIVLVIIVDEGPVRIDLPGGPGAPTRVVKRRGWRNLMYLPILSGEDGYGLTYGVRVARPGVIGDRSRLSFPLTYGGLKRAGAELDRTFDRGPLTRFVIGGRSSRSTTPATTPTMTGAASGDAPSGRLASCASRATAPGNTSRFSAAMTT